MTVVTRAALDVAFVATAVPVVAASTYLALCALLARRTVAPPGQFDRRFDVIVPAHDEHGTIAQTVASLLAMDYPRERFRVIVVADNCADGTAAAARNAGAHVIERHDPDRRGKGYALAYGYAHSLDDGFADALVVVDADTIVSPNLLAAFAAHLGRGAEAVQAEYAVSNRDASWRTRLMHLAFTLFHSVRSLARARAGVSCGLRGNGMGFVTGVVRRVAPHAFSLAEDVEYGLMLGLAGVRVAYVAEAEVSGEMPTASHAASSQRSRWEKGRVALRRRYVPQLLRAWLARGGLLPLDLALDLLIPPLTLLTAIVVGGATASVWAVWAGVASPAVLSPWLWAVVALAVYVGRGIALSGLGPAALLDLGWAPLYAAWKLALHVRRSGRPAPAWVRTARAHDHVRPSK